MSITNLLSTSTITIEKFLDDMGLGPADIEELHALIIKDELKLCDGNCFFAVNVPIRYLKVAHITYLGMILARKQDESQALPFTSDKEAMLFCLRKIEEYLSQTT